MLIISDRNRYRPRFPAMRSALPVELLVEIWYVASFCPGRWQTAARRLLAILSAIVRQDFDELRRHRNFRKQSPFETG
jgi:hypothetical protein